MNSQGGDRGFESRMRHQLVTCRRANGTDRDSLDEGKLTAQAPLSEPDERLAG